MNIILTSPLTCDSLKALQSIVVNTVGNHMANVNVYKEFALYNTLNPKSALNINLTRDDLNIGHSFNEAAQRLPSRLLKYLGTIEPVYGIIEDDYVLTNTFTDLDNTESMLHNVKTYIEACGKERIAEKIVFQSEEILSNIVFFTILQVYDKATKDILVDFMKKEQYLYKTMKIIQPYNEDFIDIGKKIGLDLAINDPNDIEIDAQNLVTEETNTKLEIMKHAMTISNPLPKMEDLVEEQFKPNEGT